MPGIFIGSTELTDVGKIKIGGTDVQEVYVGATKVFPTAAPAADFVSQWTTSNPGTSSSDQITLPLVASGTYNFDVDWGDGSPVDTITAFDDPAVTHTFLGGAGTFTVTITGVINGWQFDNGGDREKLVQISNWGTFQPGASVERQFYGCENLVVTATDTINLTGVISAGLMFRDCLSMTSLSMVGIDTSTIEDMRFMFRDTGLLTLDVSNYNTSLVQTVANMFDGSSGLTDLSLDTWDIGLISNMTSFCRGLTLNTPNYDDILAAWAAQSPVQSGVSVNFGDSIYTIATSQANRDILTDPPNSWTIADGGGV